MTTLNLKQAVRFMASNKNPMEVASNEDLLQFVSGVDAAGADILSRISDEEVGGAVTLIMSSVIADLMTDGEVELAGIMMMKLDVFEGLMAIALKMSTGIVTMEEWR